MSAPFGMPRLTGAALVALCLAAITGPMAAQTSADPPIVIRDRFGRDLAQRGITLVDWQGYIANPAIPLTVQLHPRVNLPARVTLTAEGARLMFNLFSEVGANGPTKIMMFEGPSRSVPFFMSVFPDRDGLDEEYRLTAELTTGVGETRRASWPVRVVDQDRDLPEAYPVHLDFTYDALGFFRDAALRRTVEQAARDWAYFFDDQGFAPVPSGSETAWIHDADTFERGRPVTNGTGYSGFLLFAQSIRGPEKRSGGRCSHDGGLQIRDGKPTGLRRSGTIIAEVTGNWNGLGWSVEESDDRWWVSSNHGGERHDFYSIMRHEIGHAILYHRPIPGFARLIRSGRLRSREVEHYLRRAPEINAAEHLYTTVDPVSRVGAFGNEYGGDMPRKRWMITKVDLLIAKAAGYRMRDTTPLMPLRADRVVTVEAGVGQPMRGSLGIGGGIPTYNCRVVGGSLPPGVELDAFTGKLMGAPDRPGRYRASVDVRDNDPGEPVIRVDLRVTVPTPGSR